jgi:hypothetical protein
MHVSRKVKVAVGAAVAVLAISGAAFAYFTAAGAGTGSGTVGTSTELVIHGVVDGALYPGTSSTVNFTVDNGSTGNQFVNTITLASVDTGVTGCLGTWFTMVPVVAVQDVASGLGTVITQTGTLVMENTASVQDDCKNAVLVLNLTSS